MGILTEDMQRVVRQQRLGFVASVGPDGTPNLSIGMGKVVVDITIGPESALQQAQAAAGGKGVNLMGANVGQQCLKAGLVDEMEIHVANVLLCAGRPLLANIGEKPVKVEMIRVIATPSVTHLRYRVLK